MIIDTFLRRSILCKNTKAKFYIKQCECSMQPNPDKYVEDIKNFIGKNSFSKASFKETDVRSKTTTILLEIDELKNKGFNIPNIDTHTMCDILFFETKRERFKFYLSLSKKQFTIQKIAEKREKSKEKRQENYQKIKNLNAKYLNFKNCFFYSIHKSSRNKFYDYRCVHSSLFGQNIIFDMSFEKLMYPIEMRKTMTEICRSYSLNRQSSSPYNIYICNVHPNSLTDEILTQKFPNHQNTCSLTLTNKSYIDIFPKENLIYLTPDAEDTLEAYDHNAIYIIGGLVDMTRKPITANKAMNEGIKMAKLKIKGNSPTRLDILSVFEHILRMKINNKVTGIKPKIIHTKIKEREILKKIH